MGHLDCNHHRNDHYIRNYRVHQIAKDKQIASGLSAPDMRSAFMRTCAYPAESGGRPHGRSRADAIAFRFVFSMRRAPFQRTNSFSPSKSTVSVLSGSGSFLRIYRASRDST